MKTTALITTALKSAAKAVRNWISCTSGAAEPEAARNRRGRPGLRVVNVSMPGIAYASMSEAARALGASSAAAVRNAMLRRNRCQGSFLVMGKRADFPEEEWAQLGIAMSDAVSKRKAIGHIKTTEARAERFRCPKFRKELAQANGIPFLCGDGKVFVSGAAAERFYGIATNTLRYYLNQDRTPPGLGLRFCRISKTDSHYVKAKKEGKIIY